MGEQNQHWGCPSAIMTLNMGRAIDRGSKYLMGNTNKEHMLEWRGWSVRKDRVASTSCTSRWSKVLTASPLTTFISISKDQVCPDHRICPQGLPSVLLWSAAFWVGVILIKKSSRIRQQPQESARILAGSELTSALFCLCYSRFDQLGGYKGV